MRNDRMTELTNDRMRLTILIPLFAFTFVLHLAATAAVPLKWTVETSRATPAQFEAYQGETLALEAALQSYGKPLEASGIAALYWQTNGMGSAYWETTAAVNSNRLSAVWTPEMDVGAKVYNCFIGVPGTIYHAAFQLRLRPSPGATPNVLPLPTPVIDFAKVRVLNPPYYAKDETDARIANATNALRRVDGAARILPKYLWRYDTADSYEKDAYWYYDREDASFSHRDPGMCSARRVGENLERNYDWYRDESAEFVVLTEPGPGRFASAGIANIGESLTEEFVTSGAPSRFYKCLPGRTVDGINSEGVAIEVNVVATNGSPWETHGDGDGRDIDSRWAVRWVLDNAASAGWAASNLASRVYLSKAMRARGYSVHYAIVDRESTWLVEDGKALVRPANWPLAMTNFRLDTTPSRIMSNDPYGVGYERYFMLTNAAVSLTNAWYSNAYRRNASGDFPWPTEFAGSVDAEGPIPNEATSRLQAWAKANIPPEVPDVSFPRGAGLWQTVHCSVYNLTNLTLRVAVQETDDWYTFQVPSASDAALRRTVGALADSVSTLSSSVSGLQSSKLDGPTDTNLALSGKAADAKSTGDALAAKRGMTDLSYQPPTDLTDYRHNYFEVTCAEFPFLNGSYYFKGVESGATPVDGWFLGESGTWLSSLVIARPGDNTLLCGVHTDGDPPPYSTDLNLTSLDQTVSVRFPPFETERYANVRFVRKQVPTRLATITEVPAPVEVIDPASATTTGKAADALKVKEALAAAQSAAAAAQSSADAAQDAADSAQSSADAAQATADAALPSSHPNESVYGAWDYDSYSGDYGLKIYGSGDSCVWLTPYDVSFDSGGRYSTRTSLTGLSDEISYLYGDYYGLSDELWSHIYNYYGSNPHGVTAYDVGAPTYEEVDSMIGEITPENIGAATPGDIYSAVSATQPHFRDQVLAVGMNIDPTAAAEINRILERGSFVSNCTVVVKSVIVGNAEVKRMIVESAKLYWDPGLQVTWQIDVTNGCFYSHIVSNENLVNNIH